MPLPREQHRSFLAKQVGTLALCQLRAEGPTIAVRAAAWSNALSRLGIHLPLFIVRDLGLLFTTHEGPGGWTLGRDQAALARIALPARGQALIERYEDLIRSLSESEVTRKAASWRLRDDIVAALLAHALSETYNRWPDRAKGAGVTPLPLDFHTYADVDPSTHFQAFDRGPLWGFLEHVADHALHIYTSVELIDLDTVRLLGLFREEGSGSIGNSIDMVDLFASLSSPEASDVAAFSLDLLPSILETKRAAGVQTLSVDGYASIERSGNIDSLMLTELAYDDDIFEQRVVDHELLFYGHEKQHDDKRRLQYILIDASASMRGKRQVFARGLALALIKKLSLEGDEVWMRFFDSRLYDLVKVSRGQAFPVPYLLSFRSERGRNYHKVFRQLLLELSRLRQELGREIVLYIITHGQCHISAEIGAGLAQLAYTYGIIILPSSEVSLEFLPTLHRHQIVDSVSLANRAGRRHRALDIVDDATGSSPSGAFKAS